LPRRHHLGRRIIAAPPLFRPVHHRRAVIITAGASLPRCHHLGRRIITAPPSSQPAHHCRATTISASASHRRAASFISHLLHRAVTTSSTSLRLCVLPIFVAPSSIHLLNCAVERPSFILTPSHALLTCCAVERSSFIRSASSASLNLIIAPLRTHHQVFNPLLTFSSSSGGVILLLLSLWDYGSRGILISAAYFGGLCFFGSSSFCHS
jgi:hypothetical protein